MKIPTVQPTVEAQVPTVQEWKIPGAVSGAFGEREASALQGFGQDVTAVGKMAEVKYHQQSAVKNASLENQFILGNQSLIHNPDPKATKTVKIDGKDVDVPAGYGDRFEYQASGASLGYEEDSVALRDSILSQQTDPRYKEQLRNAITAHYLSGRNSVQQHEVTQIRKADEREYRALTDNLIQTAAGNPLQLSPIIDRIIETNDHIKVRFGIDEQTNKKNTDKDINDATLKAGNAILDSGGTLEQVRALIDSEDVRNKIPKDYYEDIDSKLEIRATRIDRELKYQDTVSNMKNRFSLINQISSGQLDIANSPDLIRQTALKDSELASAMQKVADSKGVFSFEDVKDESFENLTKKVFDASSQEEISKYLVQALNQSANGQISEDKLAILVNAATQRAGSLKGLTKDPKTPDNPKQNSIDAGLKAIVTNPTSYFSLPNLIWNYLQGIKAGKPPEQAHSEAVKSEVNRTNPQSVKYKGDGTDPDITLPNGQLFHITGITANGSPKGKVVGGKSNSNTK